MREPYQDNADESILASSDVSELSHDSGIHHTAVHTARNLPKSDVYLTCQYLGSSDDI